MASPRGVLALAAAAILLRPSHGSAAVHVVRNSVAVVDAETNEIVDDVVVGDYPGPVAAGNGSVWVGNIGDSTVTEIHGDTREAEFPASAQRPVDLAVTGERALDRERDRLRDAAADGRRNGRASGPRRRRRRRDAGGAAAERPTR